MGRARSPSPSGSPEPESGHGASATEDTAVDKKTEPPVVAEGAEGEDKAESEVVKEREEEATPKLKEEQSKWKKLKQQLKMGQELATIAKDDAEGNSAAAGQADGGEGEDDEARKAREAFLAMYVPSPSKLVPTAVHPYKRERGTRTSKRRIEIGQKPVVFAQL